MWQADLLTVRLPACSACLGGALFGCANHSWLQEAFYHPERDLVGVVHGDDLVFVGVDKELDFVLSVFKEPQSDFRLETTNEKHARAKQEMAKLVAEQAAESARSPNQVILTTTSQTSATDNLQVCPAL